MRKPVSAIYIGLLISSTVIAQSPAQSPPAANSVQLTQPESAAAPPLVRELKIPAGTPLEIETAYNVDSQYVRPEDAISFRVLVPIKIDGITVIEKYSLVTGTIVQAKRGGHWGKAGKLSWFMRDVVAVDLTRVPVQGVRDTPKGTQRTTGTSHGGQVAAQIAISAPLMLLAAPIALMAGFKRGENAILPEGKRFTVYVSTNTTVRTSAPVAEPQPPKP
jgi:hypothetical protein